jgi:hypothetical protein
LDIVNETLDMVVVIGRPLVQDSDVMPKTSNASIQILEFRIILCFVLIQLLFEPSETVNQSSSPAMSLSIQLGFQQVYLLPQSLKLMPFNRTGFLLRDMIACLMSAVTSAPRYGSVESKSHACATHSLEFWVQQNVSAVSLGQMGFISFSSASPSGLLTTRRRKHAHGSQVFRIDGSTGQ